MPEDPNFISVHRFARQRLSGRVRLHRRELRELARIRDPDRGFAPRPRKRTSHGRSA